MLAGSVRGDNIKELVEAVCMQCEVRGLCLLIHNFWFEFEMAFVSL